MFLCNKNFESIIFSLRKKFPKCHCYLYIIFFIRVCSEDKVASLNQVPNGWLIFRISTIIHWTSAHFDNDILITWCTLTKFLAQKLFVQKLFYEPYNDICLNNWCTSFSKNTNVLHIYPPTNTQPHHMDIIFFKVFFMNCYFICFLFFLSFFCFWQWICLTIEIRELVSTKWKQKFEKSTNVLLSNYLFIL